MREIKFRAFIDGVGMKPVNECGFAGTGELVWVDAQDENGGGKFYTTECEVMQFTGLKDCKGREIYEGDIVKCRLGIDYDSMDEKYTRENWPDDTDQWIFNCRTDVVTMERFPCYWLANESFGWEGEDLISPSDCEVIGNIHQTPELLDE